jgi:hypothetical protein
MKRSPAIQPLDRAPIVAYTPAKLIGVGVSELKENHCNLEAPDRAHPLAQLNRNKKDKISKFWRWKK